VGGLKKEFQKRLLTLGALLGQDMASAVKLASDGTIEASLAAAISLASRINKSSLSTHESNDLPKCRARWTINTDPYGIIQRTELVFTSPLIAPPSWRE
jgi:hypothetical protein